MGKAVTEKIDFTIGLLCKEIAEFHRPPGWQIMDEEALLLELVTAILGSQVSSELATVAASTICNEGLLSRASLAHGRMTLAEKLESILKQPLFNPGWGVTGRRYRFPTLRAHQIAHTMENIYISYGSLKDILDNCSFARHTRVQLVRAALGVGPKQATLFLRNVGFTDDLAVLDSHVLRYMSIRGMTNLITAPSSLKAYENIENSLLEHSFGLGYSVGCLDQAIWVAMRVAGKETSA